MTDYIEEPGRKTPVIRSVDIVVCGGGAAGTAAAYSAAAHGARTLLLESRSFLGGLVTTSLVITTPPLDNGFAATVASRLRRLGGYAPLRAVRETDQGDVLTSAIEPELLKLDLQRMLAEKSVEVLLGVYVVGTIVEADSARGVVIESKAGRQAIRASVVVDATGDADVCYRAGLELRTPVKPPPCTMMFNMVGVDSARALRELGHWGNLREFVGRAVRDGRLDYQLGVAIEERAPGVFAQDLIYEGELNVWSGNMFGIDGLVPEDYTRGVEVSREHVHRLATFLRDNLPGFEASRVEYTSTDLGIRGTRQATCAVAPTMSDTLDTVYADTVAKPFAERPMRIPYASLVPVGIDHLLVAGRCIGVDPDEVGLIRVIPPCFATGQAAGTAAALSLSESTPPRNLDVGRLQTVLGRDGMELGLEAGKTAV